ncbi:class A beta-lactamase [Streptomonospora wellingtoniae]|uniref:Beta-lactamase n=1 Tax=Streptomonospora wellingtoniae TaxID=3075544 RepID=A0ABU2KQ61_9ACTN|nr:class A beta-lactamase [Streptomonospora sp. DSM 45055]MDT0301404.1 class A beta-lactamase [Streptomonospora sp. DSM 45055]
MNLRFRRGAGLTAAAALALAPLAGCAADEAAAPSASPVAASTPAPDSAASPPRGEYVPDLKRLEREHDADVGVYALDTGSGAAVAFNADERFAYASTHKVFSAGAVLEQTPMDELDKRITYTEDDLLEWAPITSKHVDEGMELREVIDAALRYSDNTAANLLFEELGGPDGLQEALHGIGDETTRVDRIEPGLNDWEPGELRDTSTPRALTSSLRAYTLGDELPEGKREILVDMMRRNTTGDAVIRAGVPEGWTVGDKTGSADYGTRNDIAVVWPPDDAPIVMAVLTKHDDPDAETDDALVAESAEVAVDALA